MQILTQYEREQIAYSLKLKRSIRTIARLLKRDHSVIVRELQRNRGPDGRYDPRHAQTKADRRAKKTNWRKLETNGQLHDWVEGKLKEGWSPELAAGRLRDEPPKELSGATVSHEQIYDYIYEGPGRFEGWYHFLENKHRTRRKRHARTKGGKARIPERISIAERPEAAGTRERYGDWESDLALFKQQRPVLSVQYERKAQLTRFRRVLDKTADANDEAIRETLDPLPRELRLSLTFDNGLENVCHTGIRDDFDLPTFFCHPYCSWEKGGVENAIGRIRKHLPRETNLATLTDADLLRLQEKLNDRPRKSLRYRTPNEVWNEQITHLGGALNS